MDVGPFISRHVCVFPVTAHSGLFSSWVWCASQLQTLQLFYCLEQGTPRVIIILMPSGLCSFFFHCSSRALSNPAAGSSLMNILLSGESLLMRISNSRLLPHSQIICSFLTFKPPWIRTTQAQLYLILGLGSHIAS